MNFKKYIQLVPFIYTIFVDVPLHIKVIINTYTGFYYKNEIINSLLNIKIFTSNIYKKLFIEVDTFNLKNVFLYTSLRDFEDVTDYFKVYKIDFIDKYTILDLYNFYSLQFNCNSNIRLKIFFTYNQQKYIMYYNYYNKNILPYPPFSKEIMDNYRNNIVIPTYEYDLSSNLKSNKIQIYSLFNIESKDILKIKINNLENESIKKYIDMVKTPFNDFGLLYNNYIKLSWLLVENKININTFDSFYLKFLNMYLDEEKLDLFEHFIELNKNEINSPIISERKKSVLKI